VWKLVIGEELLRGAIPRLCWSRRPSLLHDQSWRLKIRPKEKGYQEVSHFALCCLTDAVRIPSGHDQLKKGLLIVANRWCQRHPALHVSWSQRNHQNGSDIAVKHIQLSNSTPDRHSVHELDWVPS
jgi:hypothetical protein